MDAVEQLLADEWRARADALQDALAMSNDMLVALVCGVAQFAQTWERADFEQLFETLGQSIDVLSLPTLLLQESSEQAEKVAVALGRTHVLDEQLRRAARAFAAYRAKRQLG